MNMTYKERTIWFTLISVIMIFGNYFFYAYKILLDSDEPNNSFLLGIAIPALILFIVIQVGTQIILAIFNRKQATDERDRLIDLKASSTAYTILVIGVTLGVYGAFASSQFESPLFVAHHFAFSFILAETGRYITQIWHYRRGF